MKCPFCGYRFREPIEKCSGCPLHPTCKVICCPNCGYELERESRLAKWISGLFALKRKVRNDG